MANVPEDLHYSKDHEWVRVEGDIAVIGITDYAQNHWVTWCMSNCRRPAKNLRPTNRLDRSNR